MYPTKTYNINAYASSRVEDESDIIRDYLAGTHGIIIGSMTSVEQTRMMSYQSGRIQSY
jgi:hypothetical protein